MRRLILAAALTLTGAAAAARAQTTPPPPSTFTGPVTYVSAEGGSDANPCTKAAPCRQISRGVQAVKPGGTVYVVGSGDYKSFDIAKSVTVTALPGVAAVVGKDGALVTVRIHPGATDVVTLRGLTLEASGNSVGFPSEVGIGTAGQLGMLYVDDCVVEGYLRGISINAAGSHTIRNTVVRNGGAGISFLGMEGVAKGLVENCRIENNGGAGVSVQGNSEVTARNTVAAFNQQSGFEADGAEASLVVDGCLASHNLENGVNVVNGGTVRVGASTIARSGRHAFRNSGGTFYTFGNNQLAGNTGTSTGTITATTLK